MKKFSIILFVVLVTAVAAMAAGTKAANQCVPEPITMLALIPGAAMLIRRRKQA